MKSAIFELIENWEDNETTAIASAMELLEYADSLGFDEAWIGEHHFNSFTLCPSPIALMSHALARTKHIKIGSAAILLPHYHPIKLAEEIAMLDLLSKGRFLFGFARGAFPIFDIAMGNNASNNRKIMLENAEIIHNLLFKDQVRFEGEFFEINNVSIRPHPKGLIPFFVASLDKQTLIDSAKRGYSFLGAFTLSIKNAKEIYELFAQNATTKSFEFALTRAIYIDEDRNKAQEKAHIGADIFSQCMLRANESNPTFEAIIKTTDYEEFRADFFSKEKILENMIIGTPQDCLEQILELKKQVPITTLSLKLLSSRLEDSKNILKLYKERIIPYL
ncbi:LLM class flavin-dependent oxidoreductase [Helicobacter winghamensis]|uniref:Luciferase n=2 Tax=Helicobacter winghamensis TaxID=157268 RepID=A0A2N3PJB8_9HELI|nr:LLM class flavin-dependent oxidoreductase [Helicobacter winghamensis]EEO25413.1 Luciferase-like monooxygenase [Helicobacter winghamensis ATCC BAA-430]PKT78153.1 luciferase [Helicobacter winghamensis]PKT78421.1 luciferase [Helicobacter winghamensis]PKT78682.1 luciferase [Helicobacter winghamensis]PKT80452.1 luciferase [Helicobacter winghamensis]